jgi:methionyl-tRNA formyltransferase
MKAIFMGAPQFAEPSLLALSNLGVRIVCVFTKEPRRGGRRGLEATKTAVHAAAERLGLRVETPISLRNAEAQETIRQLEPDIAIVAAYGLILPVEVLSLPRLGCINLHASLLPRWRGAAPVQRAIMAQDSETGVSLMRMEVGLDTGPIAGELRSAIDPSETADDLTARLSLLAAQTLEANWDALRLGRLAFRPQSNSGITYAQKIDKAEAAIDWSASAETVRAHIHALSAFPGAYTEVRRGASRERLKVLRSEVIDVSGTVGRIVDDQLTIACAQKAIRLLRVQRAGRSSLSGAEFMRSGLLRVGDALPSRSAVLSG